MIEKWIRSPLSMMLFIIMFGVMIWMRFYVSEAYEDYAYIIQFVVLTVSASFFVLIFIHNRKNPSRKIAFAGWIPYEFKEDDEGRQWITFQACRKVYIFYSISIPAAILILAIIDDFPAILLFFILAFCQYSIYWLEERKYYKLEDDSE